MSAKETNAQNNNELSVQNTSGYDLASLGLSMDELAGLSGIQNINYRDIKVPEAK